MAAGRADLELPPRTEDTEGLGEHDDLRVAFDVLDHLTAEDHPERIVGERKRRPEIVLRHLQTLVLAKLDALRQDLDSDRIDTAISREGQEETVAGPELQEWGLNRPEPIQVGLVELGLPLQVDLVGHTAIKTRR